MSNLPENWRPVIGYEGSYEVSDRGSVRSIDRIIVFPDGRRRFARGRVLRQKLTQERDGRKKYLHVGIANRTKNVHSLVATAFVGPMPEGMQVNHCNGIKTDNRADNLEYVTPKQNKLHAKLVMGCSLGERNGHAKLNLASVRSILALLAGGGTPTKIARQFGVTQGAVRNIMNGRNWKHVA